MFGTKGQTVRTVDDAEAFILDFLRFGTEHADEIATNKAHDFDLFLPWMMEIVVNADESPDSQHPVLLDSLYMEAAWSLVQKGYLRPGPRKVSGQDLAAGYGKGYSVTAKGKAEWLKQPEDHEE